MSHNEIELLLKNSNFTTIFVNENIDIDTNELIDDVYKNIKTDIISQFGLTQYYEEGMFKEGGAVTTVHNARKGIFANKEEQSKFNKKYNRKDYEKRYTVRKNPGTKKKEVISVDNFSKIRKEQFKKEDKINDIYTGRSLPKDGRAELDHIKSAKEIYDDDWMRLHATEIEIANAATNENNLGFTASSINQSKGSENIEKWMEKKQKGQLNNNKKRFDVDENMAKKKNRKARKTYTKKKAKIVTRDYAKKISTTGLKRGTALAKKQILGILIAEITDLVFPAIIPVIQKWNSYESVRERVTEISRSIRSSFENAKEKLINLVKKLIIGASTAFASGIITLLFEVILNSFTTTTAKFGKLLKDSISSIMRAFQVIFSSNPNVSKKEKIREGLKIAGTAVITSLSLIISQSITEFIKANPTNPLSVFADEIGIGIGVLLTGFLIPTFIFTLENFGEITKIVRNTFELMKYGMTITVKDIENEFQNIQDKIDDIYEEILRDIYSKYKKRNQLHDMVDDFTYLADEQFGHSIVYAQSWKVDDEIILKNKSDIDDYFMN